MTLSKQEWGKRNHNLSSKLFDEGVYFDWSLTIAFYSAVQYVENVIFPITINGKYCTEIGLARLATRLDGRHATREKLVHEVMGNETGSFYKWLDDMSRTARYKTYKISKESAEKAKDYLCRIEESCIRLKESGKKDVVSI